MAKEIWKPIPGYEDLYDVSNMGRVRRACDSNSDNGCYKKGFILKGMLWCFGYLKVGLHKNRKQKFYRIHHLVLKAFRGPCPKGMEGSHLNDIKTDNCLKNLAWMTHSENTKLAIENDRTGKGKPTWMKGKHHSKESKRKISKGLKKYYESKNKENKRLAI